MKRTWRPALVSVLALSFSACAGTLSADDRLEALEETVTNYYSALRWGYYDEALSFHVSRTGSRPSYSPDALANIRVTSYEISGRVVNETRDEATVTTVLGYYNEDVGAVRKVKDQQTWWYDKGRKRWFLDGAPPDFRPTSRER